MRKFFTCAGLTAAFALAPAFAADSQSYDFTGFTKVDVSAGYDAEITVGGDYAVRAETDGGKLDQMNISVKGDTLVITRKNSIGFNWSGPRTVVYVTMPELTSLEVSSGADGIATGVNSESFNIDASSGADAEVSGTCEDLTADASSGADIEAEDLICRTANADASSGADIEIHVTEELIADASSGADIVVYGGPRGVRIDTSSGGDISIRD